MSGTATDRILGELLLHAQGGPPDRLPDLIDAAVAVAGGSGAVLYLVDYEEELLEPVPAGPRRKPASDPLPITGTSAGEAYSKQGLVEEAAGDGVIVWTPVRERANKQGVLGISFTEVDDRLRSLCVDLGLLVGQLVRSARRYTDVYELPRRRRDMELAAEMQWEMLLPSLCFASTRLDIDAVVEPAYDIGGDGFEYRINADVLDMVFLDAMGHSLDATLVTALALAAYRHARRRHLELPDIARSVDRALVDHFDFERFLTGHLCQLDLETGRLRWVNAGHPPPYLVRPGEPVRELTCEPALPLGLGLRIEEVGDEQLEPGDRLVFYSDGVVEARTEVGEYFGEDRLQGLVDDWMRGPELPGVVVRRIVDEVMAHQHGDLRDDATMMVLEWKRPAA